VNGQRGTASVFAMDGGDTSDPEMARATFSNFNVDAIEKVPSMQFAPFTQFDAEGRFSFSRDPGFSLSVMQALPVNKVAFREPLGKYETDGWQFLNITTLTTGPPFSVNSGIQQTGMGAGGTDRPDLALMPDLSTGRTIREDYFGRGANNAFFFFDTDRSGGRDGSESRAIRDARAEHVSRTRISSIRCCGDQEYVD
jgi:hypothetical protein